MSISYVKKFKEDCKTEPKLKKYYIEQLLISLFVPVFIIIIAIITRKEILFSLFLALIIIVVEIFSSMFFARYMLKRMNEEGLK